MIILFKANVTGVLLACLELRKRPEADLIYACDPKEGEAKLKMSNPESEVIRVGFDGKVDKQPLVKSIFPNGWHRITNFDSPPLNYIDLVLRHRKCNPAELVRLLYRCEGEVDGLYCGKERLCKRYYSYMREVRNNYHRLCMFVRPVCGETVLYAHVTPKNSVSDMLCRWLAVRNPDRAVIVVDGTFAYVCNGEILGMQHFLKTSVDSIQHLVPSEDSANLEELWITYYKSQMIDNRRNHSLSKKLQPRADSGYSSMSKKDRYFVERGIHTSTLLDFGNERQGGQ
ncbi:DUF4130 domain-containing protein [Methanohalophilus mahii]|uniref:DUF4130 domain-containing protein n=1 Tax=Methanohalophilus mahii (strain ATCC 35705 / DSM 5219 / SLP) TaxID=547558 RepID=D5E7J9_METMS|nr:DUF4130 domain-containing protein [Methanohalophilus mahii]ADE37137.1 hypothetical protein Mmah_1641 [Methanohalophilus mahii DSM 5219]